MSAMSRVDGFLTWSIGRRILVIVSYGGGLASAIVCSFSSSVLMLESFVCFFWVVFGFIVSGIAESMLHNLAVVRRRLDAFTSGVFTGLWSLLYEFFP